MTWFVLTIFFIVFSKLPPLTLIDNVLIKYVAIPIGITWFMSKKHFDGKKPLSFLSRFVLIQSDQKRLLQENREWQLNF